MNAALLSAVAPPSVAECDEVVVADFSGFGTVWTCPDLVERLSVHDGHFGLE